MALRDNNLGKFFSPVQIYMGYVFIGCGIFTATYSLTSLLLIIPGSFMAFTYTGTMIDFDNNRVKPYTSLFGIFRTGKWIEVTHFTRFSIKNITRKYTSYSRGNIRFDMNTSDIILQLLNKDGSIKVTLNKYGKFEEAQKEMKDLTDALILKNQTVLPVLSGNQFMSEDASDR
jgi:hypothetical protein